MKLMNTGKKKKGSAAGAWSGKRRVPGAGEKRRRESASAGDDRFMSVPSFENDGKELDFGGTAPAWKTYDWQGETSARKKQREGETGAGNARAAANAGRAEKTQSKEPVVNRVKPPRPVKKVKVDMRFGSEADKKKLRDERFNERREAKRQKYAALSAAAAEHDGAGANGDEPGVSGKILGRRRRAAEKRARAAEMRRANRLEKGLPVTRPVKRLPAKLAVGTAAGVSALTKGDDDSGSKSKNAKRKERREKARTARDAEYAEAQDMPGGVPGDATAATSQQTKQTAAAGKETPSAKSAPEESAKTRARREKREAAEALERRAAALREEAEADSDSNSEADTSEGTSSSDDAEEVGDWGEAFSSDEDDDGIDSDEDAALDAALAESDDDIAAEGASSSEEGDSGKEEDSEKEDLGEEEGETRGLARPPANALVPPKKLSLVDKMRAKLSGGQFRMLNEALYTTTGDKALRMVENQPGMFSAYHAGFREQTKEWPVRPVDACLKWLATQPKTLRVADFGCGDAELAKRAPQTTVHSFDLESEAKGVVACNMASVPLEDDSVEVAVFSLSLMGTDYGSFMEEAHRVLKKGGVCWIAEVRSRFDGSKGVASIESFISAAAKLGFKPQGSVDERNKMFFVLRLVKSGAKPARRVRWPALKPCIYKRR